MWVSPVGPGVKSGADIEPFDHHGAIEIRGVNGPDDDNTGFVSRLFTGLYLPFSVRLQFVDIGIGEGRAVDKKLFLNIAQAFQVEKCADQNGVSGYRPDNLSGGHLHGARVVCTRNPQRRVSVVITVAASCEQRAEHDQCSGEVFA